nr:MAG TPA: hypothetical protein [Caudoviricetes sp.]
MGTPNGFQIQLPSRDGWKWFSSHKIANCLYHMNGLLHAWSNLSFCFDTSQVQSVSPLNTINKRQQFMVIGFNSL